MTALSRDVSSVLMHDTRGIIVRESSMARSHLETWAPWKRFLPVMLYRLLLLSLLCVHQGDVSEAQDLLQVKIPSSVASDDGQWRMAPKDYANLRYSELDQITPENSKNLHVAFTFSTGVTQGHEAAPLVVDNTMYIITPYPNYLYALDLTQPGAPVKWQYEPKPAAAAQGVACCDQVNRGAAYANGRIFYNTLDGHTVAVDAQTVRCNEQRGRAPHLNHVVLQLALGCGEVDPRRAASLLGARAVRGTRHTFERQGRVDGDGKIEFPQRTGAQQFAS